MAVIIAPLLKGMNTFVFPIFWAKLITWKEALLTYSWSPALDSHRKCMSPPRMTHPRHAVTWQTSMMHYTCSKSVCCKCCKNLQNFRRLQARRWWCNSHIAERNLYRFGSRHLESDPVEPILELSKTSSSTWSENRESRLGDKLLERHKTARRRVYSQALQPYGWIM